MEIKRLPYVKVYKDITKEWRWQIMGGNGEIVGASSESFKNEQDCKNNLKLTM